MQILNLNMEIWLNSSPIIGELGNCGALKVSGEGPEVIQALQGGLHESAKIRSQKHWSQQSLESNARLYVVCPRELQRGAPTDHVQTKRDRWQH